MSTVVGIQDTDFTLNHAPTYPGRQFEGHRIEGLLFNVRAVQATFDDANPITRARWAYPDTGAWEAERNVYEFCAALPSWRDHGVLAFTINFQGGGAIYRPEVYDHYDNNAFTPAGELKPAYTDRLSRVLAAADAVGMVPIVGLFYGKHIQKMADEAALWRAAHNALEFLESTGYQNILVELANELTACWKIAGCELLSPQNAHTMLHALREAHPTFLYSASEILVPPGNLPSPELVEACDFVLVHGNYCDVQELETALQAVIAMPEFERNPKPLMINEDSIGVPNMDVSWRNRCSWGYYDQGYGSNWFEWEKYANFSAHEREPEYENLSGFQTPPVNWGINTNEKRAFFRRVKEVTGV